MGGSLKEVAEEVRGEGETSDLSPESDPRLLMGEECELLSPNNLLHVYLYMKGLETYGEEGPLLS